MAAIAEPVLFIGAGAMGSAIIRGALEAGILDERRLVVAEPVEGRRAGYSHAFATASEAADWFSRTDPDDRGLIVLAVKPQTLGAIERELQRRLAGSRRIVVTILAGASSDSVRQALGGTVRIIRVMPNLPAGVRRGITAISVGAGARPGDQKIAERLLRGVGETIEIPERLMDAFTAVAGSGPAYLFYLAEGMLHAAVRLGFEQDVATRIVAQTLDGASAMLKAAEVSPAELRARVTSKGGTTAAAMAVFEEAKTLETIVTAIRAARDRGAELAREVEGD
jgi:pyrroline-5-carboxylate reductase